MISVFYMWERRREDLLAKHEFYVAEGKARITDQFSDKERLEKEANEFAEAWLKRMERHFDPDRHDPGDFYDQAHDEQIEFYCALEELGNLARLSLISGIFHLWERSLREWLTSNDGIGFWSIDGALTRAIWRSNFPQIFELLACAGLFLEPNDTKNNLNTYRLIVNIYKHGMGDSLEQLKVKRPELFDSYGWRLQQRWGDYMEYADHTDLFISSEHIDELSDAIIAFWREIPEHITENELTCVPKWFDDAHKKDRREAANAR